MKLIMISGWAGSGKDSAANHLVAKHGYTKLSFAKILKDQTAKQYRLPRSYFDDRDYKDSPLMNFPVQSTDKFADHIHSYMGGEYKEVAGKQYHTPRTLLILEGSMKRAVDPDYWVSRLMRQLKEGGKYVIADWRYQSELKAVVANGIAPTTVRIERFVESASLDSSERDLDSSCFDSTLFNTGTEVELHEKIDLLA